MTEHKKEIEKIYTDNLMWAMCLIHELNQIADEPLTLTALDVMDALCSAGLALREDHQAETFIAYSEHLMRLAEAKAERAKINGSK